MGDCRISFLYLFLYLYGIRHRIAPGRFAYLSVFAFSTRFSITLIVSNIEWQYKVAQIAKDTKLKHL